MSQYKAIVPDSQNFMNVPLCTSLKENLDNIRNIMHSSSDLMINEVTVSGIRCALVACEGMLSTSTSTQLIFHPVMEIELTDGTTAEDLYNHIDNYCLLTYDKVKTKTYGDLIRLIMSGFVTIIIDGTDKCVSLGVQGYDKRGIDEPTTEANIYGAQEGFIEVIRANFALIRRRLKTPTLKFDLFQTGQKSRTDIALVYMTDKVSDKLVKKIKKQITDIKLDIILSSGYIEPFIQGKKLSFFSNVSTTQRPDVFCAKVNEGRVGVLIDGTPFALVVPSMFIENFQTLDDYADRPFYATYIRLVRFIAFFLAIALPGLYVAVATFHPEMFSHALLVNLSSALELTPFSLLSETVIFVILFEIIKEAGIRLPKVVGAAVSIVGGLVIGDAAVSSGLISTPLLIIVGLTATSAFVVPNLSAQISVIRIILIIAGGTLGLYGIAVVFAYLIFNITSIEDYGVPYSAPVSPLSKRAMRDVFVRLSFKRHQRSADIEKLDGVTSYRKQ